MEMRRLALQMALDALIQSLDTGAVIFALCS